MFNFHCKTAFNTLAEARAAGYRETGEISLQVGYIKRGTDYNAAPVYIAGKGKQSGKMFYLRYNPLSTRFCERVYIGKEAREA